MLGPGTPLPPTNLKLAVVQNSEDFCMDKATADYRFKRQLTRCSIRCISTVCVLDFKFRHDIVTWCCCARRDPDVLCCILLYLSLDTRSLCIRILIPKTIGNRKRDCAWGCAWGINTTWENLQIEKHKSVRWAERTPSWFVLFDLQIFSGGVYSPSATSRTISFSISNSFWY